MRYMGFFLFCRKTTVKRDEKNQRLKLWGGGVKLKVLCLMRCMYFLIEGNQKKTKEGKEIQI